MRAIVPLAALLILLAPCTAHAEDPKPACEQQYEAAHAKYLAALNAHAKWCTKNGVYALRDDVLVEILKYDPEHKDARRRLRFKKVDGEWVQAKHYKRPKNFKPKNVPEAKRRRAEVETNHAHELGQVWAACATPEELLWAEGIAATWSERRPDDEAPKTALQDLRMRRYAALADANRIPELSALEAALRESYPEDDRLHALLGEVEVDGAWLLQESKTAIERRAALLAAAKQAIAAHADPETDELVKDDLMLGLTGLAAFKSKHIRVAGTIPEAELKQFVAALQAAGPFFEQALGKAPDRRERLNAFLFKGVDELDAFMDRFPKADPALMKQQKQHGLHLFWANGNTLGAGPLAPGAQTELALGVVFMLMLADTWFGHENLPGWLDEGLARHMSFLMTGTRFGIAVGGRYGAEDATKTRNVPDAHGNWLKAGNARLKKLKSWELRLLLGKGIDAYDGTDAIKAYVLAVYLMEGVPTKAADFLGRLAAGEDGDLASRKALGLSLPMLEYRMRRFLSELAAR